jgi:hypothetical protein
MTMLNKRFMLFLLAFVCSAPLQAREAAPQEDAVREAVLAFYQASRHGSHAGMSAQLVSEELHALLRLADAVESRSARAVAVSDFPTDKPLMLEGAIFTPYSEGYSRLISIENIRKERNTYRADVRLIYESEEPLVWTDTAVVVLEDGRWKVDDVLFYYSATSETRSVKQNLRDFALTGFRPYFRSCAQ